MTKRIYPIGTKGVAAYDMIDIIKEGEAVTIVYIDNNHNSRGYDLRTDDGRVVQETGFDSIIVS